MKTSSIILTVLVILITLPLSGCVDNQDSNKTDLQLVNSPNVMYLEDGSGLITADLINKGTKTYTNIDIEILGYNENHELIFKEKKGIAKLSPDQTAPITRPLSANEPHIYTVDVKVVNSTIEN